MPNVCAVVGCGTRGMRDKNSFFRIPCVPVRGTPEFKDLKLKRRQKWIAALKRADLTDSKLKNAVICDKHFITGRPSAIEDVNHPDWYPSQDMGYKAKQKSVERWNRMKKREQDLEKGNQSHVDVSVSSADIPEEHHSNVEASFSSIDVPEKDQSNVEASVSSTDITEEDEVEVDVLLPHFPLEFNVENKPEMCDRSTQTELSMDFINKLEKVNQDITVEITTLKEKVRHLTISEETFNGDDKRTKYYTGLPTFTFLVAVFDLVSPDLAETSSSVLTKFQQFMLTLMHLRLNLPFADLAYRFNVSNSTVSRAFYSCLFVMWKKLKRLVIWPEREELKKTMPRCFQETFGTRVTLVMDCFEVFVEKPTNLLANAQVWSNYKQHHTVKFLIAVCPQGSVIFISCAWGGRTSDKELTLSSGILDKLLPGDLLLADRGFLVKDAVGLHCAEVKTPSFTKGQKQLTAYEIEESRKISNVRIHVERIIGTLRQKYTILSSTLRTYILSEQSPDEIPAVIDQIVTVCCALCNICPTVVPLD